MGTFRFLHISLPFFFVFFSAVSQLQGKFILPPHLTVIVFRKINIIALFQNLQTKLRQRNLFEFSRRHSSAMTAESTLAPTTTSSPSSLTDQSLGRYTWISNVTPIFPRFTLVSSRYCTFQSLCFCFFPLFLKLMFVFSDACSCRKSYPESYFPKKRNQIWTGIVLRSRWNDSWFRG